ncbi:response regulator [Desulfobotulus sp. H1]|uniref:histidine kinase n=1 Tax=Desulfobotulus pelophilus TaxID=2823377 RepID=A0ABT3N618_9BACT|nr:response regulator [Desulfobotulus pelophilus]MCW7752901.1 response regulator [Desulfobotulus pelophilus]
MTVQAPPPRIMIIDDTPANLTLMQEILQTHGYRTVAFPNGTMALAAVNENPPDLILLDIRMPEMDGFEVCRHLKQHPLSHNIPVIFISALNETEDKLKAFAAGGVDYVSKPFQPEEIHARVKTHLRLQRLLRESEQRQEVLIQELPDLVMRYDRQGRHLFISSNIKEINNIQPSDYIGKTHRDLNFDPAICQFWENALETVFRTAASLETEYTFSGREKPMIHHIKIIPEYSLSGGIVSALAVSRDITPQKKAEKAMLQAKEAAEAANLVKSEFLANMSHELRTPLNGILGVMYLLQNTSPDTENAEIIRLGINSANRLAHLLTDIIDFANLKSGKPHVAMEDFDLQRVCESIHGLFALTAMEKKVTFTITKEEPLPGPLMGDAARLRQILFHLVGNALKFTKQGTVHLEIIPLIPLPVAPHTVRILFVIADTGIGISQDLMEQIWEPFRQAENSSTRCYEGAGLGLALIRKHVLTMGGTLSIDSIQGKGTEVFLLLPFNLSLSSQHE